MKIETERFGGGEMSLQAFADRHGLVMQVRERPRHYGLPLFLAEFKGAEVMDRGFLRSAFGDGDTPMAAIMAYASEIAGHRLAINAYTSERFEVDVPNVLTVEAEAIK